MLKTLKSKLQGFVIGVFVTILTIGICHIEIRFNRGPESYELSQTEAIATHLAQLMPATKPVVPR